MSYAGAVTTYQARLVAAGQAVTPKITTVVRGEPKALAQVPVIAYWWGGRRESDTGGNTFGKVNVQEGLVTTIYVPDSVRLKNRASQIEDYLRSVVDAIWEQLWNSGPQAWSLGGHAIGIELSTVAVGWADVSKITARTADFTTWVDLAEVHTIA